MDVLFCIDFLYSSLYLSSEVFVEKIIMFGKVLLPLRLLKQIVLKM